MPLASASLSSQLQAIANGDNVVAAQNAWADAFNTYMQASAAGAPLNPAIALTARSAMFAALGSLNSAGATALQAGVAAYWTALNVAGAYGASTAVTPPPSVAGLAAALSPVFAANTAGNLSKVASCDALAAAWHPLMFGGTALIGGIPTPIL